MNRYVISLTRNMGIGKDIVNFFKNRGCIVLWHDSSVLQKTIIISTNKTVDELMQFQYVDNVRLTRKGVII